jgi:rare lipoprotein A (peptidoglycan hydrolase)
VGTLPTGSLVATASGDGISVTTDDSTLLGNEVAFTGITAPKHAGSAVVVQRLNAQNEWIDAATGTVNSDGAFSVMWRSNASGHVTLRAVLERTASATRVGNASPTLQITVYRPGIATFYGTGFFGHKTACGGTLQPDTLGVASRTLKCGTRVELFYQGRTIVVPVIDRGPYANNATWDLTQATAAALGITGTETVGAMKV